MRKGKRKAIHTFGEVVSISGAKPYRIEMKKVWTNDLLCTITSEKKIEKGLAYIVIAPFIEGLLREGEYRPIMRLTDITTEGNQIFATFESKNGEIKKCEIKLDDRGRAKNLVVGNEYLFEVFRKRQFFERYERGSIPVGKGKRSEPDEIAKERIKNFIEMAEVEKGDKILDTAAGIKDYLKYFYEKGCHATCLNISPTILKRTREWLGNRNAAFVAYDIEMGLPFKNDAFDIVICDALLEYVFNPHEALKQASGLIRKDGKLLLLEPIKSTVQDFYPQDLWEVALWRPRYDPFFNEKCMEETLKATGFEILEKREMRFRYPIYKQEEFCQSIVKCRKKYIYHKI
jgi:SAM-dependent methyltransferase